MKKTILSLVLSLMVCSLGLVFAPVVTAQDAALPRTLVPANKMDQQWWKDRHEANKARIAQGNVDLLLVGDSITHGWDGSGKAVEDYYYGDRNCVNMGFGGDQTQHVLWRLNDAPMDKICPKAAVLLIGINSLWGDWENCSENVAKGIVACVDKLQSLYPDCKILVLDIFPAKELASDPIRDRLGKANAIMTETLKDRKNVTVMSINDLWLNDQGTMYKYLTPDFCHPNQLGYKLWGAEVEPIIAQFLGVEAKKPLQ